MKLILNVLLLFISVINCSDLDYAPQISAVLKYLNANPNRLYEYKTGFLVEAQQKADITELTLNIDVTCLESTQHNGIPCREPQQICNGFIQKLEDDKYKVLSTVVCDSSEDISNESTTVQVPITEQESNIELSHEAASTDYKVDTVTTKVNSGPCLGCPFDLNINVDGVSALVDVALRHIESEKSQKHTAVNVIRLQQQVVAGIKYILILEVAPTICEKNTGLSNNCPRDENASTSVCEVVFLEKPWINTSKYVIKNNCTLSQEYNVDMENDENNNDNEVDVNKNISSEIGKTNEINLEALLDLESQILPEENQKKTASKITDSKVEDNTASKQKVSDNSNNNYNRQLQETVTLNSVSETENSNNDAGNESLVVSNNDDDSNEGDIQLNKVKRSPTQLEAEENGIRHRKRRNAKLVGAPAEIEVNSAIILQLTQDTLNQLDSVSNHSNRYKVVNITSATSQVVAGTKYSIGVEISLSKCSKDDSTQLDECEFLENATPRKCHITVWDRPWLNKREITVKCDDADKTYTFETESTRRKRSIDSRSIGTTKTLEAYETNPQVLRYVQAGLQRLNSESTHDTKFILNKIVNVTKKIVSGNLWQITVEVGLSDCPKYHDIEQCQNVETSDSKTCQFEIWEQPWLVSKLNVDISCGYSIKTRQASDRIDKAQNAFQDFLIKFNRSYVDEFEHKYRLKVFRDNLKTIKLLNKYERGTAKYGITQFADLTQSEFSKSHGLRLDLHNENNIPFSTAAIPNITLPEEFDWRSKGVVTEVKNQGSCGSCWAFSTTGNVEGQYAIKYGKLLEFSEQELVDCDKLDEGCNGGLMDNAYRTIEEIGGLETESDYPYEAENEKCHFSEAKISVQLSGALNISQNETDMAKWLVKNGPIAIGINANAMQFYVGGVSHPWKVLCNPKNLDHGVLIVGYGVHYYPLFKKTLPYWIVKNSWGPSWGEQGYYRVYRGDGTCGVNQTPSSSIVT